MNHIEPYQYIIEKLTVPLNESSLFKVLKDYPYFVLLNSSLNNSDMGKYTIAAFEPFLVLQSKNDVIEIIQDGKKVVETGNPLDVFRKLLAKFKPLVKNTSIPFVSGCIGYFSYDLCKALEELPDTAIDDTNMPDMLFGFYNKSIVIDHKNNQVHLAVSSAGLPYSGEINTVLQKRMDELKILIKSSTVEDDSEHPKTVVDTDSCVLQSNFSNEGYIHMVERAREYIRNGDIFQVNLSQRFRTRIYTHPYNLFERLKVVSPAPFAAYLGFHDFHVVSNSPERFLKITDNRIETKPIKGTRPRGKTPEEDAMLKNELLGSAKDRAELTMIVDLERNDLGRICKTGTVKVEKLIELEEYATVFHLVSTVTGELVRGMDIVDCIRAAFPGGSITGAPKIRAMEIIEELEKVKRGIYTGSIGYVDFNGDADLNIAIRTIVVKGQDAFFSVGGGIVWDSIPQSEFEETLHKGKALMEVLLGNSTPHKVHSHVNHKVSNGRV